MITFLEMQQTKLWKSCVLMLSFPRIDQISKDFLHGLPKVTYEYWV